MPVTLVMTTMLLTSGAWSLCPYSNSQGTISLNSSLFPQTHSGKISISHLNLLPDFHSGGVEYKDISVFCAISKICTWPKFDRLGERRYKHQPNIHL